MLNTVYRLVAPRRFEVEFANVDLNVGDIIVRPTHLAICNADQRYYQGKRAADILKEKLPMALIHEGIGKVVYSPIADFKPGDYVAMIPNTPQENDSVISENYLRTSKFRASGFDGFMQDIVPIRPDRLIPIPPNVNLDVASFTEIVSVSYHAISRFESIAHSRRDVIGIWGDGNLGYITAVLFKALFPDSKLYIFGIDMDKLSDFSFADETYSVNEIPSDLTIDHAFECVGGDASGKAINQIIDYINPEGTISILGVSENLMPLNTRMILEKGLRVFGSSRSGRIDFENTLNLYRDNPQVVEYMEKLVGMKIEINSIEDMKKAFEFDIQKASGKTIMLWNK